jgi:hypothetical protein
MRRPATADPSSLVEQSHAAPDAGAAGRPVEAARVEAVPVDLEPVQLPAPVQAEGEADGRGAGEVESVVNTVPALPDAAPVQVPAVPRPVASRTNGAAASPRHDTPPVRTPQGPRNGAHPPDGEESGADRGATGPQLRRFIKSRAYVPMHELRRRFAINGHDDEVTAVDLERHRVFVGLPDREGRLLGELLRGGDIGYELSMDPITPIVVGVYPMRPVTRP